MVASLLMFCSGVGAEERTMAKAPETAVERLVVLRDERIDEKLREVVIYEIERESGSGAWKETKLADLHSIFRHSIYNSILITLAPIYTPKTIMLGDTGSGWGGFLHLRPWQRDKNKFADLGSYHLPLTDEMGPLAFTSWVPSENLASIITCGEIDSPYPYGVIKWDSRGKIIAGKAADISLPILQSRMGGETNMIAAAFSPDGSLLAAAGKGRLYIFERTTGTTRYFPLPAARIWALTISANNKTAAWIGEEKPQTNESSWAEDGIIRPDSFGLVNLDGGKATAWRLDRIESRPKGFSLGCHQAYCRVAQAKNGDALYFMLWKGSTGNLARFDIKRETLEIIAKDVQSFAVPYEETKKPKPPEVTALLGRFTMGESFVVPDPLVWMIGGPVAGRGWVWGGQAWDVLHKGDNMGLYDWQGRRMGEIVLTSNDDGILGEWGWVTRTTFPAEIKIPPDKKEKDIYCLALWNPQGRPVRWIEIKGPENAESANRAFRGVISEWLRTKAFPEEAIEKVLIAQAIQADINSDGREETFLSFHSPDVPNGVYGPSTQKSFSYLIMRYQPPGEDRAKTVVMADKAFLHKIESFCDLDGDGWAEVITAYSSGEADGENLLRWKGDKFETLKGWLDGV